MHIRPNAADTISWDIVGNAFLKSTHNAAPSRKPSQRARDP